MASGNHEQAKQVRATRRAALGDTISNAQKFARVVRDFTKSIFGNGYTDLYMALGFHNSLAVSHVPEDLKNILQAIVAFLTNNPTLEVGTVVTAVRAQTLHDALVAAEDALASKELIVMETMHVRNDKYDVLRKRITNVYQELRMELDTLDPR